MAYLVAVTACVSGVAHTYMAAERLEKLCQLEKWGVSIETQGALGTENRLADEDIRRADVALLITDIELAGAERGAQSAFCAAANPSYSGVVGFSVSWLWYCRRYSDGERSVFLRNRRQK